MGFLGMIVAELSRPGFSCGSCQFCLICTFILFFLLCLIIACLSGSYMLCMLVIVSSMLESVEYLHSMSCRHLLPLYVRSSTNWPLAFI